MAYIGQSIKNGTFLDLGFTGTFNSSTTDFNLGTQVGSAAQLLVSKNGVIQRPGTDYTLATGGTQISFTTAPASGDSIFIVEISGAVGGTITPSDSSVTSDKLTGNLVTPGTLDVNGQELILDADADTSITADTDDQIDVKIGGTDQFSIKDGVIEPTTDNDVDIGASSKEFKDGYFDGTLHCDVLDLAGTEYTSITGGVTLVDTIRVTSTSTYTPTSGTKFFIVYACGGGGGGGTSYPKNDRQNTTSGGNGGNTTVKTYDSDEMGANAAVTIGSGGSAGSGNGGNGGTGGDTTFNPAGTGSTITGKGGYGSYGHANTSEGGTGLPRHEHQSTALQNGDYVIFGEFGHYGQNGTSNDYIAGGDEGYRIGGAGGRSAFGPGANFVSRRSNGATDGNDAPANSGGGASGTVTRNTSSTANGGAGGSGYVIVEEYA